MSNILDFVLWLAERPVLVVGAVCLAACWHYYRATTELASRYEEACDYEYESVQDVIHPEELPYLNAEAEHLVLQGWTLANTTISPLEEEGGEVLRSVQLTRRVLRPRGAK